LPSHGFICVYTEVGFTKDKQLIFFAFSLIYDVFNVCTVGWLIWSAVFNDTHVMFRPLTAEEISQRREALKQRLATEQHAVNTASGAQGNVSSSFT